MPTRKRSPDNLALHAAWERFRNGIAFRPLVRYAKRTWEVEGVMFAAFHAGYTSRQSDRRKPAA